MPIMEYACDIAKGVADCGDVVSQNGIFKFFPACFLGFIVYALLL